MQIDQVPQIVQALQDKDLEMVYVDDDDQSVKGPDNQEGWFNNGDTNHAVSDFDTATVRSVVDMLWFFEAALKGGDTNPRMLETIARLF